MKGSNSRECELRWMRSKGETKCKNGDWEGQWEKRKGRKREAEQDLFWGEAQPPAANRHCNWRRWGGWELPLGGDDSMILFESTGCRFWAWMPMIPQHSSNSWWLFVNSVTLKVTNACCQNIDARQQYVTGCVHNQPDLFCSHARKWLKASGMGSLQWS